MSKPFAAVVSKQLTIWKRFHGAREREGLGTTLAQIDRVSEGRATQAVYWFNSKQASITLKRIHVGVPHQHPPINSSVNICLISAEEGTLFNPLDLTLFCVFREYVRVNLVSEIWCQSSYSERKHDPSLIHSGNAFYDTPATDFSQPYGKRLRFGPAKSLFNYTGYRFFTILWS